MFTTSSCLSFFFFQHKPLRKMFIGIIGRQDLNLQPFVPKTNALPVSYVPIMINMPMALTRLALAPCRLKAIAPLFELHALTLHNDTLTNINIADQDSNLALRVIALCATPTLSRWRLIVISAFPLPFFTMFKVVYLYYT